MNLLSFSDQFQAIFMLMYTHTHERTRQQIYLMDFAACCTRAKNFRQASSLTGKIDIDTPVGTHSNLPKGFQSCQTCRRQCAPQTSPIADSPATATKNGNTNSTLLFLRQFFYLWPMDCMRRQFLNVISLAVNSGGGSSERGNDRKQI